MTTPRKIRWLIAHQPEQLFVRTARAFSEELAKLCGDELEVEILTPPTYAEKYGEIDAMRDLGPGPQQRQNVKAFWNSFTDGAFEMSQMQVGWVGEFHSDFRALDLPYLFEDHDHVSRVVDGEIGQELCAQLAQRSAIRGLAFTYSGGYRVIGSDRAIQSLDDLQGLRVVVQNQITLGAALDDLGIQTMEVPPSVWQKNDAVSSGLADAVETTYLRFDGDHVLKTNHSMFMTTILVTNAFWNSLTPRQQQAFGQAAKAAAAVERSWALQDAANYELTAAEKGIKIIDISEADAALLKKKSMRAYMNTRGQFTKGLIGRVKAA